jgi:uncharacterized protein YlxW (UPF0749 family)
MEYTSGASSWSQVRRRLAAALVPRRRSAGAARRPGWSWGVPLIVAAAGLLFTTTATTAAGTDLREDRTPQVVDLIDKHQQRVTDADQRAARLRREVEAQTDALSGSNASIAAERRRAAAERAAAGLVALHGPGLTVRLDDAPRRADGTRPNGVSVDDLVVHQQDVQAVVNALWAGGAEAMSIMDDRIVSTSAVRCVGNTLLLHGRAYGPPFKITALGDPATLRQALDASPGVALFREAAESLGLGYRVTVEEDATVPGYDGSTDLEHAQVPR